MKTFAISILASLIASTGAHAQAIFSEFSIGAGFPSKVETIDYSVTVDSTTVLEDGTVLAPGDVIAGRLSGDFNAGIAAGIEIGMRGVGDKHISASVSYDYLQANLESITASGTIAGAPASETQSLEALGLTGADFNNEADLVLGNLRYDFVGPRAPLQPFIGIGAGGAFIEDSRSSAAFAATAGVRAPLGLGFFVGARYRYVKVLGYEDQIGIEYKDLNAHILSLTLGAHL